MANCSDNSRVNHNPSPFIAGEVDIVQLICILPRQRAKTLIPSILPISTTANPQRRVEDIQHRTDTYSLGEWYRSTQRGFRISNYHTSLIMSPSPRLRSNMEIRSSIPAKLANSKRLFMSHQNIICITERYSHWLLFSLLFTPTIVGSSYGMVDLSLNT
jgi:hypothetical protein